MPKWKGVTKPLLARYAKLLEARATASQAIYNAAFPRRDVGWQQCYRNYASQAARDAYDAAQSLVFDFECQMAYDVALVVSLIRAAD